MNTISTRKAAAALMLVIVLLATGMSAASATMTAATGVAPPPCNDAEVVAESIPYATIMKPGEAFVKAWLVKNTGSCTWTDKYALQYDAGLAPNSSTWQALEGSVSPGASWIMSIRFIAPSTPGVYVSTWHLIDNYGARFGPDLIVAIAVPDASKGSDLPDTLAYFAGGGGTGENCDWPLPRVNEPVANIRFREGTRRQVQVCVYGLPARSTISAALLQPDGGGYSAPFYVGEPLTATDRRGKYQTSVLEINLRWPDNTPNGTWQLSLDANRFHYEKTFAIQSEPTQSQELRILPSGGWVRVFDTVRCHGIWTHSYPAGEQVMFTGYGYLPDSQVMLGIYRGSRTAEAKRVNVVTIKTDDRGNFRELYRLPSSQIPGEYWVVPWQVTSAARGQRSADILLGRDSAVPFYVRATSDSPLLDLYVWDDPAPGEIEISATNLGKTSTQGGTITVSSPDVSEMKIVEADVPIKDVIGCTATTPQTRVLTSRTPCSRALQYNTGCRSTVKITYPMVEGWYQPWSTGERHTLRIAFAARPGVRQVRLYVRAAALVGASGCEMEIAPDSSQASAKDQQGFPVQVVTVPVSE